MKAICIECWNPDAVVTMDLDGSGQFRCAECGAEFGCEEVKEKLDAMKQGWDRLLKWAESYPTEDAKVA